MSGRPKQKKGPVAETAQGPKAKYVVAEIPTKTDLIIMNKDDRRETYNVLTAVCKIMNDVEELMKK